MVCCAPSVDGSVEPPWRWPGKGKARALINLDRAAEAALRAIEFLAAVGAAHLVLLWLHPWLFGVSPLV